MKIRWQQYLIIAILVILVIMAGYSFTWTGFGEYTLPNGDYVPAKRLWDWLELLIIPVFLAIGVFFLNRAERKNELEIAHNHQNEAALQAYLGRMSELLLKEKLKTTQSEEVCDVARILTLTTLLTLDKRRRLFIIQFLREANLINKLSPIIKLDGAYLGLIDFGYDFNLREVNLAGAQLHKANMFHSDLSGTVLTLASADEVDFSGANLSGADFSGASLFQADFRGANLSNANLSNTYLLEADFFNTNLTNAKLLGAKISDSQLAQAKTLVGAIMPDGTKHD